MWSTERSLSVIDESTTCYRHPDRRASSGCQRCDRPICTEDMKAASVGFHCPECVKEAGQRVYTTNSLQFQPLVTQALIAVNVLAYFAQQALPDLTIDGLLFGPLIAEGEWWRLLTSGFLHGSLFHIGFNMYLLWMIGPELEKAFGKAKFLLLYFGSLFAGAAAVTIFNWDAPTLGASGAVLGLAGAMAAVYQIRGFNFRQSPVYGLVVLNLALPVVTAFVNIGFGRISFWGHFGGMVGGAVIAAVLIYLPERGIIPKNLAVSAAAAAVVGFAVLGLVGSELGLDLGLPL